MDTLTATQNSPINIRPEFFASDFAAGFPLNGRAMLGRDLAITRLPLADKDGILDADTSCEFGSGTTGDKVFAEFHKANHSTVLAEFNSTHGLSNHGSALFNAPMRTVEEIRHAWLMLLIEQHGSLAELNEQLGRARNDATLQQIKNKAPNTRTGKIRSMGSDLAREIEDKLKLERGTLDNPPPEPGVISAEALEVAKTYQSLPQDARLDIRNSITRAELAEKWKAQQSEQSKSARHG